jgi:thiosulfate/3-mercaptopyruvate sulfurtransferase
MEIQMRLHTLGAVAILGLLASTAAHAEQLTDKPLVDAAWLTSHLGDKSLLVIDIRDAAKDAANPYAAGHVPGAVSAPYSAYGWRATVNGIPGDLPPLEQIQGLIAGLGVNDDTQVVIVPAGTDASEFGGATRVYWTFKVLGHDAVTILNGGWSAWTKASAEVSTEASTPVAGDFKATLRPELIAEAKEVKAAIDNDTSLIDARSVAQFIGQEKTNTVKELGTIPTAVNINFDKFYDPANASFASADVIAKLAHDAGVTQDSDFIAFCNTGHLASIAWFGLSEIEGFKKVRLYDGSMAEWTTDASNPVVTN